MKNVLQVLSVCLFACFVSGCAGGKDSMYSFEEEPPFTITHSFFQRWLAGVEEGGAGVIVHLTIENVTEELEFRNVYFRNKKEKATQNLNDPDKLVAYFKKHPKPDVIMDSSPVKEAQNKPPETFPFVLRDNEAVLSYFHKGEEKYLKIVKMEEKPMIAYPSANPNGIE